MQLTNRSKAVVKKEMNFWERIYLPAVLERSIDNDQAFVSQEGNGALS